MNCFDEITAIQQRAFCMRKRFFRNASLGSNASSQLVGEGFHTGT